MFACKELSLFVTSVRLPGIPKDLNTHSPVYAECCILDNNLTDKNFFDGY